MFYRAIIHSKQFRYLGAFYVHSLVRLFAVSIFQIFSSVYIYRILLNHGASEPQALAFTALTYCLIFIVQALSVAPSLWIISRKGLRFSVFFGNLFLVLFYAILYLAKFDPIFLILAAICSGLQIGLYWTAYQIYFAELTDDKKQGEEIGIGLSLSAIASIGGPAFGGLIISFAGFETTFLVITIILMLANLPLKYLPKQKDVIKVNIVELIRALAPKKEFKSYLALGSISIVDHIAIDFWPLFVFPILAGFVGLGFMGSVVALIAAAMTIATGFLIDKIGPKKVISVVSSIDSLTWALKTLVTTPFHVLLASSSQAITLPAASASLDSEIFKRARHTDLIAFITQREIGLALGRVIYLLIVGILFWFGMPLKYVFIMAAVITLFSRVYPDPLPQKVITN